MEPTVTVGILVVVVLLVIAGGVAIWYTTQKNNALGGVPPMGPGAPLGPQWDLRPNHNAIYALAGQPNTKYYGMFNTEEDCRANCAPDSTCNAYAWHPHTGFGEYNKKCYGRTNAYSTMVPQSGMMSGIKLR